MTLEKETITQSLLNLFPFIIFISFVLYLGTIIVKKFKTILGSGNVGTGNRNVHSPKEINHEITKNTQDDFAHIMFTNDKFEPSTTEKIWKLPVVSEAIRTKKQSYQSQVRKITKELRESKNELEALSMSISLNNISYLEVVARYLREIQNILLELNKMSGFEGSHDTEAVMVMEVKLPRLFENAEDLQMRISKLLAENETKLIG